MNERKLRTKTDDRKSNPSGFEDFVSRKKTFRTLKKTIEWCGRHDVQNESNNWWKMLDNKFFEAEQ